MERSLNENICWEIRFWCQYVCGALWICQEGQKDCKRNATNVQKTHQSKNFQSICHSLIIGREISILTLSILITLQGCISCTSLSAACLLYPGKRLQISCQLRVPNIVAPSFVTFDAVDKQNLWHKTRIIDSSSRQCQMLPIICSHHLLPALTFDSLARPVFDQFLIVNLSAPLVFAQHPTQKLVTNGTG